MTHLIITDHAMERLQQRFGIDCTPETLEALLWSYPIVRTGVQMAEAKPIEEQFTEWRAKLRRENMVAVFRRNAVVTLYPIGGRK